MGIALPTQICLSICLNIFTPSFNMHYGATHKLQSRVRLPVYRTPHAYVQLCQDPLSNLRRANEIHGASSVHSSHTGLPHLSAGFLLTSSALRRSEPGLHWTVPSTPLIDSEALIDSSFQHCQIFQTPLTATIVVPSTTVVVVPLVPPHQRTNSRVYKPDHS